MDHNQLFEEEYKAFFESAANSDIVSEKEDVVGECQLSRVNPGKLKEGDDCEEASKKTITMQVDQYEALFKSAAKPGVVSEEEDVVEECRLFQVRGDDREREESERIIHAQMDHNPPFEEEYKALFESAATFGVHLEEEYVVEECQLPQVDLGKLKEGNDREREECKKMIVRASMEWGFFQVVNHGVSADILREMKEEQMRVFQQPFWKKRDGDTGCYRWGTPSATCLRQLSWSEVFHVPLDNVSSAGFGAHTVSLSLTMRRLASVLWDLGLQLATILAENIALEDSGFIRDNCVPSTCYLRMNRYPTCPNYSHVFGLMPHTDSDFLTILYQDQVGGLQLLKDSVWIRVTPNPDALIINIGDLFQAWSNDVYKSVEHRVVANKTIERFSTAYFLCPSQDAVIQPCREPHIYRKFSFKEYREQVQDDVKNLGHKRGLSQFRT